VGKVCQHISGIHVQVENLNMNKNFVP
jgi:hypothetical protein